MPEIKVEQRDGQIVVTTPYDPDFPPAAREIGGAWSSSDSTWRFDPRDEQRVRELVIHVHGTDGTPVETVTVRVALRSFPDTKELYLFGRRIAGRRYRDSAVRLGDGVVLVAGGFPSSRGGSVNNPRMEAMPGTVLEIRDVPAGHRQLEHRGVTVVDQAVDVDALKAERERLVARLAEIDDKLATAGEAAAR